MLPTKRTILTPAIQALFCDLGNVLVFFHLKYPWLWKMAKLFSPRLRMASPTLEPVLEQQFRQSLIRFGVFDPKRSGELVFHPLDIGRVPQTQLHRAFLAATGLGPHEMPPERFWPAYTSHLRVIPETCALVKRVQACGIPVIAATDCDTWAARDLVALHADLCWDGVVMSWQISDRKPGAGFFSACREQAENALGRRVDLAQCLLVDDRGVNLDGFRQLGGKAIRFAASRDPKILAARVAALQRQLIKLGVPMQSAAV